MYPRYVRESYLLFFRLLFKDNLRLFRALQLTRYAIIRFSMHFIIITP